MIMPHQNPRIEEIQKWILSRNDLLVRLAFRDLDALPQNDPVVWAWRAKAYQVFEKPERAAACLRRAHELSDDPYYLALCAGALLETEEAREGVAILEHLIASCNLSVLPYTLLARHMLARGEPSKAAELAERGLNQPELVHGYLHLHLLKAMAHEAAGDTPRAKEEALLALSLLLRRDVRGFVDLPLPAVEAIEHLIVNQERRGTFSTLLLSWILEGDDQGGGKPIISADAAPISKPGVQVLPIEKGRGAACEHILRALPDWFGIESAIQDYERDVEAWPCWGAYEGDRLVGFLAAKPHRDWSVEIAVMGVLPDAHGLGIGRVLVAAAEAWARASGVPYLTVKTLGPSVVYKPYEYTRRFYEAVGFAPIEELMGLWDEGNPTLVMIKPLQRR